MKVVDVNLLLYVVNQESTHHATVRCWWEAAINGQDPLGM